MQNGIAFTEYNVAQDQVAQEQLARLVTGRPSLPVITVDDEVILGFDRSKLEQALDLQ